MTTAKKTKKAAPATIKELARRVNKPATFVRARLRRHLPHPKGKAWEIPRKRVPEVIKLLK